MMNETGGLSEQILNVATDLFVQKGYHGLSMREIAEALGVTKAAIYYHYKDKEELFYAILIKNLEEMGVVLDRVCSAPVSASEKINQFVHFVLGQAGSQRAIIRLSSQEFSQLNPELRNAFDQQYREKFIGKIGSILNEGMQNGEFRAIQPEIIVWALLGIMFPYFYPGHFGNLPVPRATIEEIIAIYIKGISA
jgi:AcrR family transcriptional regulator